METNERKSRSCFIAITIVLVLLILIILFFTFKIYNNYNFQITIYKQSSDRYNELVLENDNILNVQQKINNDLNDIHNIDKIIFDTKENVFGLASQLEQKILNGETDYKIAYLTFDDGPYYSTYKYLDVLDKYGIKATFFTIGADKSRCYDDRSKDCTNLYKEIVDRGHTIANHTYSHAIFYGLYNSADSFINQVNKQEELIKEKTGVVTNIVRFPGGVATSGYLKNRIIEKLREEQYGWVDWSASNGDGGALYSTTDAWNNFTKTINEDIEVVLFHDYSSITLAILPQVIEYLQDNNYIILPLFYESVAINK